jgi:DNA-binding SARP family transcriptional activator
VTDVQFGVLGSLEVVDARGAPIDVGGAQPRTVLALLLIAAGRVVTVDALTDALWGDEPPSSAAGTLQSYISRLRRHLEPDRDRDRQLLRREPPGYRLAVDAEQVDFRRFEVLADEGRAHLAAGRAADARDALLAAEALWRGPALVEFQDNEAMAGAAARLEDRRLAAIDDRVAADLALGRHTAIIGELTELIAAHPLREGLRRDLALALYRSGRQAEALRALDDARRVLRDELGVEPSRPLRELEQAILAHDRELDAAEPPSTSLLTPTTPTTTPSLAAPASGPPTPARAGLTEHALRPPSGLVGRDAELAQLRAALDEVWSGATRVLIVEGEPGIGKTRLVEELCAEATDRGAAVHWGHAFEGGAAPAFWPWMPPLRALIAERDPDAAPLPPELAIVLAPTDRSTAAESAGPGQPAELARFAMIDAVVALLADAARGRPVVLAFDDVQWADVASLELLATAMGRVPDVPLLVAVTVRELELGRNDAVVDTLAALTRRTGTRRLQLRGLGDASTAQLVAQTSGRDIDASVAAAIHDRAEGNPFFTTELARLLAGDDQLLTTDVPSGVRDVVRRRLAQVPEPTLELLRVAAIVGRDVDVSLVARASGTELDASLDDLDPALLHRLLVMVDGRPGSYRFAHALVREVLVDDMSPLRQARLHLRIAEALDDSDDLAEIVAEHLWNAAPIGVGTRAADALERAAEVAVRRLAYADAMRLLERAVQLRQAAAGSPGAPEAELAAVARLVSVQGARRGYPSLIGSPLIARGKELAEQTGRARELINLLWAEWAGLDVACEYELADPIAVDLLALSHESPAPIATVIGHTAYGISCWHRGAVREGSEHMDLASDASRRLPAEAIADVLVNLDQVGLSIPFAVYLHDLRGDLDDPEAHYDEAVRRVPGDRYWELLVMNFAASGGLATGDPARAVRAGRRGVAADPDSVSEFWSLALRAYLGTALALTGDLDEGLPMFDDAWTRYTAGGTHTNGVAQLAWRTQALATAGRVDEALASLDDAHRELARYRERYAEPSLLVAEATVQHAQGDADAARHTIKRAADLADEQGSHGVARGIRATADRLGIA